MILYRDRDGNLRTKTYEPETEQSTAVPPGNTKQQGDHCAQWERQHLQSGRMACTVNQPWERPSSFLQFPQL